MYRMKTIQNICICGGGSLGLVCAGVFLSKGVKVSILTGHPENWSKSIEVYDPDGKLYSGELVDITSEPKEVIPSADMIFLTLPGYMIEKALLSIKPWLRKDTVIGAVVASTGFFFMAHDILGKSYPLFGFQRVPFIARYRTYGQIGDLLGYKAKLNVAIENCDRPEDLRVQLENLLGTPITVLDSFYEVSLSNSNPILHTGRLYQMWKDYKGEVWSAPVLFYSQWTDEASEYLIKMDGEFQSLLRKLGLKSDSIPPLLEYYESKDAASLTAKIRSIPAFRDIKAPMKEIEGEGWIPDFSSRYFTEDFPYGLRYIRDLARQEGIETPAIDEVYEWGMRKLR